MSSARDRSSDYPTGASSAGGGTAGAGRRDATGTGRETATYPESTSYPEAGYGRAGGERYDEGRGMSHAGSTVLAATLLILSGLWSFIVGMMAILRQSFYHSSSANLYQYNVHDWGWLHFALGIAVFAAGMCVLLGQTWAKVFGIVLAVFSGLANFMFLPYYPFWSIVLIAIDVFVIWALASSIGRRATT
ncbi:MAG TPA: hypothetical protein VGG25_04005 [Streptosporangiaceae bacterium]|jgi:hypothetical protein